MDLSGSLELVASVDGTAVIAVTPPTLYVNADSDGVASAAQTFLVTMRLKGPDGTIGNITNVQVNSRPTGITDSGSTTSGVHTRTIVVPNAATKNSYEGAAHYTLQGTVQNVPYVLDAYISIVAKMEGKEGEPGESGEDAYSVNILPSNPSMLCSESGQVVEDSYITVVVELCKGDTILNGDSQVGITACSATGGMRIASRMNTTTGLPELIMGGTMFAWWRNNDYNSIRYSFSPDVAVGDLIFDSDGNVLGPVTAVALPPTGISINGISGYFRYTTGDKMLRINFPSTISFTVKDKVANKSFVRTFEVQGRQVPGAITWFDNKTRFRGEWQAGATYIHNDSRRDFTFVKERNGNVTGGYLLTLTDGTTSYSSNTSPANDVYNGITGHWKFVSFAEIGFFGTVIASLVRAQTGDFDELVAKNCLFDNITLTGVLNNLINSLDENNYNKYGCLYEGGSDPILYLNPLKCGQYLEFADDLRNLEIILPCYYYGSILPTKSITDESEGDVNVESFTLQELRQMVGKRIVIMPKGVVNPPTVKCDMMLEVRRYYVQDTSDDDLKIFDTYSDSNFEGNAQKVSSYDFDAHNNARILYMECKTGIYKGCECIYWEVQERGAALEEYVCFFTNYYDGAIRADAQHIGGLVQVATVTPNGNKLIIKIPQRYNVAVTVNGAGTSVPVVYIEDEDIQNGNSIESYKIYHSANTISGSQTLNFTFTKV